MHALELKPFSLMCRHPDFVTAVVAHPLDDRLFLSGSIEGKVRLWNVAEQRVVDDAAVHEMVSVPRCDTTRPCPYPAQIHPGR